MKRGNAAGTVATLALVCVFGVTLLMGILAGAAVYQRVGDRVTYSAEERVGLTYITAKIHGFDTKGAVQAGTFGGSDAVYLMDEIDGVSYETILYVYQGQLMELLCQQGGEPAPAYGEVIGQAQSLTVEEPQGGLLRLVYTGGDGVPMAADVFLRSEG